MKRHCDNCGINKVNHLVFVSKDCKEYEMYCDKCYNEYFDHNENRKGIPLE